MNKENESIIHQYLTLVCENNKLKRIKINFKYDDKKGQGYLTSTWDEITKDK